jgi:VanZ family protein
MKSWIFRWGPAVIVMLLIFAASATPSRDLPSFGLWDMLLKKGGHMFGYALLAAAYFHALNNGKNITRKQFMMAILLAVLYAATDEFHQKFTPGRFPSLMDVLIDTTGATIGLTGWRIVRSFFPVGKRLPAHHNSASTAPEAES